MRNKLLLVLVVFLALAVPTPSFANLPFPSSFYGTVKINGLNLAEGTPVTAWINGVKIEETVTALYNGESIYSLNVRGDDPLTTAIEGGRQGEVITFYIADQPASPTTTWQSGTNRALNLSTQGGFKVFLPEVGS